MTLILCFQTRCFLFPGVLFFFPSYLRFWLCVHVWRRVRKSFQLDPLWRFLWGMGSNLGRVRKRKWGGGGKKTLSSLMGTICIWLFSFIPHAGFISSDFEGYFFLIVSSIKSGGGRGSLVQNMLPPQNQGKAWGGKLLLQPQHLP